MRKVMLVIDEIQQLVGLETFMRRLGFDVLSLSKDSLVSDALLGFQPEIVIASQQGRNVDGLKLSKRLKKTMVPPPRIAISYHGAPPVLSKDDQRSIDALIEIPAAGENAIRLLAQLGGLSVEPLLEKYRRFSSAKLTTDEQIVIIQGGASPGAGGTTAVGAGSPSGAASARTDRSSRYDAYLENHAKDLAGPVTKRVLPRERAAQLMKKLKEDSKGESDLLDRIQAEKLKFAEALFDPSAANTSLESSAPADSPDAKKK